MGGPTCIASRSRDSLVELVLAISGASSSGKSTLSRGLLEELGGSVRAFGAVVESESLRRGRSSAKEDLQETGVDLISEGWDSFVRLLLSPAPTSNTLIVDGIRHRAAIDELSRQLPGARLVHVHVATPRQVLVERTIARSEDVTLLDHAVEAELPEVARDADVVVQGDGDPAANRAAVLSIVLSV